jgi:hypothetical protein
MGETEEAYNGRMTVQMDAYRALEEKRVRDNQLTYQTTAWSNATSAAVVELVRVEDDPAAEHMMGPGRKATLRPVSWIKGRSEVSSSGRRANFSMVYLGYTSCGPAPDYSAFNGNPGERYVAMFSSGRPSQDTLLGVFAPDELVVGDVVAALATRAR